ncbi:RNA polymerase sigma factor RpoH [Candidatus Marithrix sp. Canyon 246]|uniref:RNA polymerase sigma factor RpoH n=1 Tax=Candidatus Marithrix sp. Canyon 246 TaxID=1827136 RepID=UPI00084A23F2|nr:RNA polymerase sigma factor RpoH [Candidatus Marithrix sp. Canyon 246]
MSTALTLKVNSLPAVLSQDADSYTKTVKLIPILNFEEEQELAKRLKNDNDLEAARQLVVSHLRFVLYIAKSYRGYGLPEADLIQEGNIGLMKAVKRFDPSVGVRLVSFAVHWIRAEIHEFILRNWRIVKIVTTKAQRKLFFNLRSMKKRLGWFSAKEIDNVAKDLGVTQKDVLEMEKRLSAYDIAFDAPNDNDDDENFTPATYLVDKRYDPAVLVEKKDWENHNHILLQTAFKKLDERSQYIVEKRWLSEDKVTLQTLANKYNISAERIRQIENNAINKLKKYMN